MKGKIYRLIDANINRSLEGLRVTEDISRFILDDIKLTRELKAIRHTIKAFSLALDRKGLIACRNIKEDVGKGSIMSEAKRTDVHAIFKSNIKRLQESIRVLEEFSKLVSKKYPVRFKNIRYAVYHIDKEVSAKLWKLQKLDFDLYVISDKLDVLKKAAAEGAKIVQLRVKDKPKDEILKLALKAAKLFKNRATLIINDHPDIAKRVGADGVHVGFGDMGVKKARKILGDDKIVGVSAHNLRQVLAAQRVGADYAGLGPIFSTPIKAGVKPLGIKTLQAVMNKVTIPVVAIGGINKSNIHQIVDSGCKRMAVIRAVEKAGDVKSAVRGLLKGFSQ